MPPMSPQTNFSCRCISHAAVSVTHSHAKTQHVAECHFYDRVTYAAQHAAVFNGIGAWTEAMSGGVGQERENSDRLMDEIDFLSNGKPARIKSRRAEVKRTQRAHL